ncbi:O-antigen ligase family protein [Colwellia sp. KU-HH00111]|uniref:O-antigen ligase family protein n=1 Tax=Colwellia sp. KU-HH00111 TaxID=3127652 RepID=UPI0033654774
MEKLNNALFYCFLTLIFWVPIPLGSNRPWAWSIIEIVAFTLLAIYLMTSIKSNEKFSDKLHYYKPLLLLFLTVQLWLVLQYLPLPDAILYTMSPNLHDIYRYFPDKITTLSLDPAQTKVASLKGLAYFCIMLLSIFLITNEKRLKLMLTVMVLSGTFQAVYGSLQALSGNNLSWVLEVPNSNIATGGFIYKNHFANFLLLCIAIGIGLLVTYLSKQKMTTGRAKLRQLVASLLDGKGVIRIALAIMVIALVMSRSRMGNAAFFIAMTLTGIFAFIYFKNRSKNLSFLLISLFVIDTFILGSWFGLDKVKQRMEETSFSRETRDEVNIYGLELIKKFPISGTGAGSFYTVFPMVQQENLYIYYDHAHNDYLQFAIEYGLPSTLLLGVIVLWSLWQTGYTMRHRRNNLMKGTAFGCMMAITGMIIHISVDFNLQAPANAVYFVLIITLAWQSRYLLRYQQKK